jgi:uncharacterized protein YciW
MSTTRTVRTETADVIDSILGASNNDTVRQLRGQKPELARQLQDYYLAIFAPVPSSEAAFPLVDRALIAVRVATHTRSQAVVDWYTALAEANGASPEILTQVRDLGATWDGTSPFGAAIRHADLVTTAPSQTSAANLDALKAVGYTPAGILSLAQTIAFVSYQLRLIAGLRAFGDRS